MGETAPTASPSKKQIAASLFAPRVARTCRRKCRMEGRKMLKITREANGEVVIKLSGRMDAEVALVLAAKSGDRHAFETLIKRYQRRMLAVARRFGRIREDAEDIVQQSFQKAFVHLHKFEGKSSFSTWV